jgi:hypothetical protein
MDAKQCIEGVQTIMQVAGDEKTDIIYVHPNAGGAICAIVKVGTPAYNAITDAYPDDELEPHSHVEPDMW